MATEFQMPKLGLTMEEGTITEWLVETGTAVEAGTAVLTIETDKVDTDVEASDSGILHITGQVGEVLACGARIGWFLAPGESPPAAETAATPTAAGGPSVAGAAVQGTAPVAPTGPVGRTGRILASPYARRVAAERGIDLRHVRGSGPDGRIVSEDLPPAGAPRSVAATLAAHQVASRLGVDLVDVRAKGADGRVGRADVERHLREQLTGRAAPTPAVEMPLLQVPSRRIPLAGMRGTIAQRMHASLAEMAQLTLTMEVVMDAVVAHRMATPSEARASYTDYVIAATAQALVEHPVVNSQIADGAINLLPEVNVGLAVALDGGLIVPVINRTDRLDLADLAAATTRLATAARTGSLKLAELEGGTFSVTALGAFGVDSFTPVINPPNTAILGVGRLREAVRWVEGSPVPTTVLTLSLTWDHRAFDGAPAAEFTATIRDRLEAWDAA